MKMETNSPAHLWSHFHLLRFLGFILILNFGRKITCIRKLTQYSKIR